jgi:hypothetical protein
MEKMEFWRLDIFGLAFQGRICINLFEAPDEVEKSFRDFPAVKKRIVRLNPGSKI